MVENKRTKIKTKTSPRKSSKRSPKTRMSAKRKSPKRKVTKLPQLRDLSSKGRKDRNKKYKYHIHESDFKRRRAINEGIKSKKTKSAQLKAAKDKKARFNVLRIYRRYKNPKECKIITKDMRYIDKKYLGPDAKTSDIC
jgi:hypothetical protein